jgi:HAD superfamily hydrolase (TIGR01509 family)|tara:strand:- start:157 stop:813 length:657 start_codon:yes stop_codon:yes gene_type:complete
MSNFELIIFDCDGVIVDSERIANEVFAKVLNEEFGFSLSLDDMFQTFVGYSSSQCMAIIKEMLGEEPPPHLESRYKEEINHALATSVTAVSGIENAITNISIPYCVASSGSYEKMHTTLGKTKLLKYFDGKLHSTTDVDRGKPFPDIYLYAAKKMGVLDPSKCLVIEDSPLGVKGGVSAGMTVFGYSELMDRNRLINAGAHHTFNNMYYLANEIQRFV